MLSTNTNIETPFERQMRAQENAIYNNPNGWMQFASEGIKDINARLQLKWAHEPLTKQEEMELVKVIQTRFRNRVRPTWSEDWSEAVVNQIMRRDGVKEQSNTVEVVTANDALAESEDAVDAAMRDANQEFEEDEHATDSDY